MQILCVGGSFKKEGGRPSGYFGKLVKSLAAVLPTVECQVLNGGFYAELAAALDATRQVTHVLWFVDVPNDLPKLLPLLKERYPGLVIVSSKNNRQGLYTREALAERMRRSRSEFLVEFANGTDGKIVGSVLTVQGSVALESSECVDDLALCLVRQFDRLSCLGLPLLKRAYATADSASYPARDFAYETEIPLAPHVGAFGVTRRNHVHEGVDLYGMVGDPVLAMEPGTVVWVAPFTGEAAGSPWWNDTSCVLVQGDSGGLNYGEITVASGIVPGAQVLGGQVLGTLAQVLKEDKGRPMTMLHLERYGSTALEPVKEWSLGTSQPAVLCDPTMLLLHASTNAGTRTAPARKQVCIVGERGQVSRALQERLARAANFAVMVVSTDSVLTGESRAVTDSADLLVLCTQEFASPQVMAVLPASARVLDVSPAFRIDPAWVYGLAELPDARERIAGASKVANPGCFATSAILVLEPMVRAGLVERGTALYLDGVGGFTTGGAAMVEKAAAGLVAPEAVFSLTREHRHVCEIKHVAGLTGPVMFSPKVARVPKGIRMQVPLFGVVASEAREILKAAYTGTQVVVEEEGSSRLAVDDWAGREGACIRVYEVAEGCLVVCTLDNMGKGAVDSAFDSINLMLG